MSEASTVSRRDFLKGAAVVAAASAALTLEACADESVEANYTVPPAKWDQEYDVVVVGGGVGLVAAIEATVNGADTVILEAGDHIGGLFITAGGSCTMGGGHIVQQREGVEDSVEAWYLDELYSSDFRGEPDILRVLCEKGPETVAWMEELGFKWAPLTAGVLRPPVKRGIQPAENPGVYRGGVGTPNGGLAWIQVWEKRLTELNVPIELETRMVKVYRDGMNGPVVGVQARKKDLSLINIKARKAVVLCTGTWTDNAQMAKQWDPRVVGENAYGDGGVPSENLLFVNSAGDGHVAANRIGAQFSDMSFVSYLYIFFGSRSYWGWGEDPIDWTSNENYAAGKGITRNLALYNRTIIVDGAGRRYVDEANGAKTDPGRGAFSENPEWPFTANYLALPQPRNVWLIADSEAVSELDWPMEQILAPNPRTGNMFDPACIAIADTIEELAAKMDIDAQSLAQTIERYNGFVDAGKDEDFGKEKLTGKIAKGPFYGLKASLIRHTQRNGLRVNTKSQVIDGWSDFYMAEDRTQAPRIDDEPVIPRLYAAGEVADSLGWRRPHNTLGHYTTIARIAGQGAAAENAL